MIVLAALAVVLGIAVAGTPDTGQSPRINNVNPTKDTPAPVIDTRAQPDQPVDSGGVLTSTTQAPETTEAHHSPTTAKR